MGRNLIHSLVRVFVCDDALDIQIGFVQIHFCSFLFGIILAVTTLRIHPAETRLTVYRLPYIVCKGNCSTKGGRTIHMFSNFDLIFRDRKWCNCKKFWNRSVGPCFKKVSRKYHGQALRNKKVIRVQASWSMNRKFWNDQLFHKIDAAEGFGHLN